MSIDVHSDDIFSLENPPGKTLIVGGSYIALEVRLMIIDRQLTFKIEY